MNPDNKTHHEEEYVPEKFTIYDDPDVNQFHALRISIKEGLKIVVKYLIPAFILIYLVSYLLQR